MRLRGVTGMPDFLLRRTRWGFKWSRVGDFHDSLYYRGCPRVWADEAYERLCEDLGLRLIGWPTARILDFFSWAFYRPKTAEGWTPEKLERERNATFKQIVWETEEIWGSANTGG